MMVVETPPENHVGLTTNQEFTLPAEEHIFLKLSRPVRCMRLIAATIMSTALAAVTCSAVGKGISQGAFATPAFIMPLVFAPIFLYLAIGCVRVLIRGGQVEIVISTLGIRCRGHLHPWSQIGYFGPSAGRRRDTVTLAMRTRPIAQNARIVAFRDLDQYQPVKIEVYQSLVEQLRPFLARSFPKVQLGC